MITIIQSPEEANDYHWGSYKIFLAGGISGCPDWQGYICEELKKYDSKLFDLCFFNPRRVGDLVKDGDEALAQIKWEDKYLDDAFHIVFWFPEETLCPITLYELGKYARVAYDRVRYIDDMLTIGIHPGYKRSFDIEAQLRLMDKFVNFDYDIDDLIRRLVYKLSLTKKVK